MPAFYIDRLDGAGGRNHGLDPNNPCQRHFARQGWISRSRLFHYSTFTRSVLLRLCS